MERLPAPRRFSRESAPESDPPEPEGHVSEPLCLTPQGRAVLAALRAHGGDGQAVFDHDEAAED